MRFSEEQTEFAQAIRNFADTHCATLQQRDKLTDNGQLKNSPEMLEKLAELGWLGVSLPAEFGGGGAGMVDECIFLEETSRGLVPIHSYSTGLTAAQTYLKYGNDDQKRTIVQNMVAGKLEAISLSEPGAGSDLSGVRIRAVQEGDDWIIDGQKTWCSAAHVAENILLLARTDTSGTQHQGLTLFMVPRRSPGLDVREIRTMEARTVNDLYFTQVRVPSSAIVGHLHGAWKHLMRGLAVERLIIAVMAVGSAQRAVDDVIAYTKQREQFGRTISSFQAVQHRIADLATEVALCRSFVYDLADRIDHGEEDELSQMSSMAKMKCTETAKAATLEAMQLMGGYGYAREYGMEEQVRHNLVPPIYGGTNEIQRGIIAKTLGL